MRVAHISSYDTAGGAARAAWRLHGGLRQLGVDSSMVSRYQRSNSESVHRVEDVRSAWSRGWDFVQLGYVDRNRTQLSDTYFTIAEPGMILRDLPAIREADVLHLHWVQEFQSPASLAALIAMGKPIVWTLHDQRPFTGGCHYSAGCTGFESVCHPCPQLLADPLRLPARTLRAQRALLPADAMTVVTPSRWLAALARRSALFREARIEVIPYGLDTGLFAPMEKAEARRQLGLAEGRFIPLFCADRGSERRKGAAELLAALGKLPPPQSDFTLLCFGEPPPAFEQLGARLHNLGYLRESAALRLAYCAADVFVLPSLEDNLPNTALEALACGTPVLAFDSGGIGDVVRDGSTGWLVPRGEVAALAATLARIAQEPEVRRSFGENGAVLMAEHYSAQVQAQRYLELYSQLSPRPAGGHATPTTDGGMPSLPRALWSAFLCSLRYRLRALGSR